MGRNVIPGFQYSPSADYELLKKFTDICPKAHVGGITSNDYFYQPSETWWHDHQAYGILAVEMETYMLYTLAAQFKRKALSVNTVADHFEDSNKNMSPEERQTGFSDMIEAVLKL